MDEEVESAKRRYQASISMLETIESALEPLAAESVVLANFDLTARFRADLRRLVRALCVAGAEPTPQQEEAYEAFYGESFDGSSGPSFGAHPDAEPASEKIVELAQWIADFEDRIGGSIAGEAALTGLTAGICESVLAVGRLFVERGGGGPEPRRILAELDEAFDAILAHPDVPDDPPSEFD